MRTCCLFAGSLCSLALTAALVWGAPSAAKNNSGERSYRIDCRIVDRQPDGTKQVVSRPKILTLESQPATLTLGRSTPILASARPVQNGAQQPAITVLNTGLAVKFTIVADRPGYVAVDTTIESSDIESIKTKEFGDGERRQSARVQSRTTRVVECVKLGETLKIELDDAQSKRAKRIVEFKVSVDETVPKPRSKE